MRHQHRIVIADDIAHRAATCEEVLRLERFEVRVASNRDQLRSLLEETPCLLIVAADFGPGPRASQKRLAALHGGRPRLPLPVIVVSPVDDEEDRLAAFRGGADAYLVSPVSTRELVLRVRAILRRAHVVPHDERRDERRDGIRRARLSAPVPAAVSWVKGPRVSRSGQS